VQLGPSAGSYTGNEGPISSIPPQLMLVFGQVALEAAVWSVVHFSVVWVGEFGWRYVS